MYACVRTVKLVIPLMLCYWCTNNLFMQKMYMFAMHCEWLCERPSDFKTVYIPYAYVIVHFIVCQCQLDYFQTEANRQMHIALLKQIVSFLNRVKEHIECQKNEPKADIPPVRALPKSFNLADLPRSRSVLHVNKNIEYSINTTKKISTRKISKSISNVNGYKDCSGVW